MIDKSVCEITHLISLFSFIQFEKSVLYSLLSLSSIKYLAPEVKEEIKEKYFWVSFVGFIVFMAFLYGARRA